MAQRTRSEYTVLNMLSGFVGYAANFLVGMVSRMVFTRVFSADYLGVTGLFTNVLNMLSLAELGIGSAIVYALYKPLAQNNEAKIASLVRFYGKCYRVIAAVVLVIGLALIPFLDLIITEPPNIKENLYVLYLISLFNTVSGYLFAYRNSLLQAAQKSYIVTLVSNSVIIVQNIVQIVIMLCVGEYLVYALAGAFFSILTNFITSEIAKKQYPCIKNSKALPLEKEEKRSLVRNVRALTINRIGGLLVNSTDNIIITYFSGLATVGLVSNYSLITSNLATILTIIFNSVNASIGNHNATEGTDKRYGMFSAVNLANFWLYGFSAIIFVVISRDLVTLLFGENYILPMQIPIIMAINFYMVGMQKAVWTYINTLGLFRYGRYLVLLTAAINLVVSIYLGNIWGLFGIYLGSAVSRALTNTWYSPYALFKHGFHLPTRMYFTRYLGYLVLLVATGGVCWLACSAVSFSSLIATVAVKAVICCIVPNAIFLIVFGKTKAFGTLIVFVKSFAERILNRLKKKA